MILAKRINEVCGEFIESIVAILVRMTGSAK